MRGELDAQCIGLAEQQHIPVKSQQFCGSVVRLGDLPFVDLGPS